LVPGPGTIVGGILGGMAGDAIGRRMFKFFFPNNIPKVPPLTDDVAGGQTGFNVVDELSPENQVLGDVDATKLKDIDDVFSGEIADDLTPSGKKILKKFGPKNVNLGNVIDDVLRGFNTGGLAGDKETIDGLMQSMYYDKKSSRVVVQPVITQRTVVKDMKGEVSRNSLLMSLGNGLNISNIFYERGSHAWVMLEK